MKLEELWLEKDLAERFDMNPGKTGRCRTLTRWIGEGLKYVEKHKRRYFIEEDVVEFMIKFRKGSEER